MRFPPILNSVEVLTSPVTSNFAPGAVLPMPTLPLVAKYNWPLFVVCCQRGSLRPA